MYSSFTIFPSAPLRFKAVDGETISPKSKSGFTSDKHVFLKYSYSFTLASFS